MRLQQKTIRLLFLSLLFITLLCLGQTVSAKGKTISGLAEINGGKIYYEVAGEGSALVLIHGGFVDSRLWDEQIKSLSKPFKVIRYDLRGFGKSEYPTKPFSNVEDLYELLKFLKLEKAAIIGLSLGGMVGADFTLEHPEMVTAFIPVAAGLRGFKNELDEKTYAIYRTAFEGNVDKAIEKWMEHPFFASTKNNNPYQKKMKRMMKDNARVWSSLDSQKLERWNAVNTIERLEKINVPTLVIIGGEDDKDLLEISEILHTKIPNAKKIVIPGTSHHLNMEKPEEFNQAVLSFLSNTSQNTGSIVREFCTNVGPVILTFDGKSVTGQYRLVVTPQPRNGTIKGKFKEGFLDADWTDPDGKGRIVFGFASDFSWFTAIFNNQDKNPSHWFESAWRGVSTTKINDVSAERRQSLRCEWK